MITFVVILTLLMWSVGFSGFMRADAASLTFVSDILSDSDLGVVSNHTIKFSTPTGVAETETIVLTFEEEFNLSTSTAQLGLEDFDVATSSDTEFSQISLAYDCSTGSEHWAVATSGQTVTFTICSGDGGAVAAAGTTTIFIGNHASSSGTGNTQIINPTQAGSYEVQIAGSQTDSGETRVAIVDDVVVTASVDTSFTFTVAGVNEGLTVNSSPTTTGTTTTATSIPFGELIVASSTVAAQDLTVTTNATHGFVVTVEANTTLLSSTGADIDTFSNGTDVSTPSDWVHPTGSLGSEQTYGHWGLTSEDDLNSNEFDGAGGDNWVGNFVGTPRQIFENDGPSVGSTPDVGTTRVGYQVQITALQEAGNDYEATLTYVATPTF